MPRQIEFRGQDHYDLHECVATRDDQWFIFKCPHCTYERRIHRSTNQVKIVEGDPQALHRGVFIPVGIDLQMLNAN